MRAGLTLQMLVAGLIILPAGGHAQNVGSRTVTVSTISQDFPDLSVDVRAQRLASGGVSIMLAYHNKTSTELLLMLCAGRSCGNNKTFIVDDAGNEYEFAGSSGIGRCCYSSPGSLNGQTFGELLRVPPHDSARATLRFKRPRHIEVEGTTFMLASAQLSGTLNAEKAWRTISTISINIDGIPGERSGSGGGAL